MTTPAPLPPGSTLGIMGGGQLGRMTALAAARLGYPCHVFCPDPLSPAAQVSAFATVADYGDLAALHRFAEAVDVVTFEFENIPHESVQALAEHVPVRPGWQALHVAQDRLREKDFLAGIGVPVGAYARAGGTAELAKRLDEIGRPAVLKTARMGYDGKGQVMIDASMAVEEAWDRMGADVGIVEAFIDLACEVSVVLARGLDGTIAAYDVVENRHVNHILDTTIAPADVAPAIAGRANEIARTIIEALGYVGLMAVELFVTRSGDVLVNEIAPRPHNSGHWSIDACVTSQFEQFVRAVVGLPLGSPERHANAVMHNLIGDAVEDWPRLAAEPGAHLHLYGKAEARPGRKMGHVTRCTPIS